MAKKEVLKQETVDRVQKLVDTYKTKKALVKSEEFLKVKKFMNKFEKTNADTIVDACFDGKTYDEIRFMLIGDIDNATDEQSEDPEMFIISQHKVIESSKPVTVTVGDDDEEVELVEAEIVETKKDKSKTEEVFMVKDKKVIDMKADTDKDEDDEKYEFDPVDEVFKTPEMKKLIKRKAVLADTISAIFHGTFTLDDDESEEVAG